MAVVTTGPNEAATIVGSRCRGASGRAEQGMGKRKTGQLGRGFVIDGVAARRWVLLAMGGLRRPELGGGLVVPVH